MSWYKRSDWTDSKSTCTATLSKDRVLGTCLHWPGGNLPEAVNRGERAATASWLRATRASQMSSVEYDYCDIEYNVAVDRRGNVWDLRGLYKRGGANGTTEANEEWVSCLVITNLTSGPNAAQIQGIKRVLAKQRDLYGNVGVEPHQEFRPTQCPGAKIVTLIDSGEFDVERHARAKELLQKARAKMDNLRQRIAALIAKIR